MPFVPLWIFFGDCLPGVEFPAETQALQVQPEIDLDKRQMRLEFYAGQWLQPDTVGALCLNIAEATNCRVTHELRFAPGCFGEPAFGWLLQKLREAVVVVNGFLHTTQITYEAPLLRLLTSGTGKSVLEDVDAARWIKKFVQAHFDLQVHVEIEAGEEKPLPPAEPVGAAGKPSEPSTAVPIPSKQPKPSHLLPFSLANGKKIMGLAIQEQPIPMERLEPGDGGAVIVGEVFGLKDIRTKDGARRIVTFYLTDYTDTVACKIFEKADSEAPVDLKDGACLLAQGVFEYDKFTRANCLRIKALATAEAIIPTDDAMADGAAATSALEKRAELHLHTNMSEMDGLTGADKLVERAAAWGHKAIAVTDHGVAQAFPAAMEAGEKYGVKILYGMEAYYVDDMPDAVLDCPDSLPFGGDIVVFDVETTGLNPQKDRVIEIGAVKISNGEIAAEFQTFVDPERELPARITELTRITPEMLTGAPKEWEAASAFAGFCGDCALAAHNAAFDMGFLKALHQRHGEGFERPCADTLTLSLMLLPELKNHRLDTLAGHFRMGGFGHHRADDDARVTGRILLELMALAKEKYPACQDDFAWFNGGRVPVDPKKRKYWHMILLAKSQAGLKNLYKLITKSNVNYYYYKPRVPKSALLEHREGLLVGSACAGGELYQAILRGEPEEALLRLSELYDYFEIQPNGNNAYLLRPEKEGEAPALDCEEELCGINRKIIALAEACGKPVVATGDVHYLDERDGVYREVLQSAQGYDDADAQAPLYFRTTGDMLAEFAYLGEEMAYDVVVRNPNALADEIEALRPYPEGTFTPSIPGSDEDLRESCYALVKERYGDPLPEYVAARLEKELDSIIRHGFSVLYVIAQKLVQDSEAHGYYVGSRGSVGSSFAANAAGISEVNPLVPHYLCPACKNSEFFLEGEVGSGFDLPPKDCPRCGAPLQRDGHDIPFETFLGFKGDKQPDIDLNFSGEYQFYAHRYTEELFGKTHVFKAGTIGTLAEKTAAFFVKKYIENTGKDMSQAEIERLVKGCEGVKRTTGQHPGGMVVIPGDMEAEDFTPVQYPANDESKGMTTHFDFHSLHETILKLDNLGHDVPTMYTYLERFTGITIDRADVCDPRLYELFASPAPLGVTAAEINCPTGTLSLPELGTPLVLDMLVEAKPRCFADLLQVSGLSHGTGVWKGNAQDLIRDGTCTIAEVIGTRDNIMIYLMHKGLEPGMAFQITEIVRKGKAKKLLTPEHIEAMKAHGVEQWYIDSCMKIQYMFPKAHASAYLIAAMRLAWYKVYHPLEYYAAYMTVRGEDLDTPAVLAGREAVQAKIKEIKAKELAREASQKEKGMVPMLQVVNEMMARGIGVLPVDIYKSHGHIYTPEDGKLRLPFACLEGCGKDAAEQLASARDDGGGKYLSKEEFKKRAGASAPVMAQLEEQGAFRGLSESAQMSLFDM